MSHVIGARRSVVGERWPMFWVGCAAISLGVLLHLPMLAMAHSMGNHLSGMPMDCGSAWKRDPGNGVIGVEKGPLIPVV